MGGEKIKNFKDLNSWKEGHILVILVYKYVKLFPKEELFGLVSQMKRSSASVTSNIAEGFGRYGYKEKIFFYRVAFGSLIELQDQIEIAKDVNYINQIIYTELYNQAVETGKVLSGLITAHKKFQK